MNDLENIPISFSTVSDNNLISLLLYGNEKLDDTKNQKMLMPTIRFIKKLKRKIYSKKFLTFSEKSIFFIFHKTELSSPKTFSLKNISYILANGTF